MKPYFAKCSCENANYKGYTQHNSPVNLNVVIQIKKIRESYYPDNEGTPAIEFICLDEKFIKWVYGKHQEANRNADYERLISNDN